MGWFSRSATRSARGGPSAHRRLIESREWWHSIDLGEGIVTPGKVPVSYLRQMLAWMRFPESFRGQRVLDIGALDGFFSFEAERRGASRVVAYDLFPPDHHGFAAAKHVLGSRVEYVQGSAYDLSPAAVGTFDVVFLFGVLNHLRYPLLALDRIRDVTDGYLLLETHHLDNRVILADGSVEALAAIDPRLTDVALYQFYRHDELMPGDFSHWFAPNRRAIEEALSSAGFLPEILNTWGDRIAFKAGRLEGVPEYRQQTYDGLTWQDRDDGRRVLVIPPRAAPSARPASVLARMRPGAVGYAEGAEERIAARLEALGVTVVTDTLDPDDVKTFVQAAGYREGWPDYYPHSRAEKALEHYVAAWLLDLARGQRYLDVGSQRSPAPDVYESLFGVEAYRQDLGYVAGINGRRIGGDAARMPVPDGFASRVGLHDTFQHFEGDTDTRFVAEVERVLAPGGVACVVPLYLAEEYAIQTDPQLAAAGDIAFDPDAAIHGVPDCGNRHGRFYDPERLVSRVLAASGGLTVEVHRILGAGDVDPSCYVRFALVLRKPADR
jgi:SAM-dependent methyltransferase